MSSNTPVICRKVCLKTIIPVRHEVLRPGLPLSSARFVSDDHPMARHWAAFPAAAPDGKATGCLSLHPELPDEAILVPSFANPKSGWRLRGMAVLPKWQGLGVGRKILQASLEDLRFQTDHSGLFVWCNAREKAVPFYRKNGFTTHGQRFEIPGIGPHFFMYRPL